MYQAHVCFSRVPSQCPNAQEGQAGASRLNTLEMSLQEAQAALGEIQEVCRRKAEEARELGVIVKLP
jgi:hypothetical protein